MEMAVYERFEDMPIWRLSKDLAVGIYRITKDAKFRRTSISVSSNMAEGFEGGSRKELQKFFCIAKGSLG